MGGLKAMAEQIDGVEEVKVDIEEPSVVITFDAEKTTAEAIQKFVNDQELVAQFHPYLTLSEGIKLAAITFGKDVKKLS